MLVLWHESRYEINYSHFLMGGWRGVLKWCNVQAHKITISASTIGFRPTLTYESTSADLRQQRLTSFCAVWCIIWLQKGKYCDVFRGEGCNARDKYLFPVFVTTFCIQTWHCGALPWAWMTCEKMGFYLQGQGHSVGSCSQNMTFLLCLL